MGHNQFSNSLNGVERQQPGSNRSMLWHWSNNRFNFRNKGFRMPPKGIIILCHLIGVPVSIFTLLNIQFDTWQGWIMLIISGLYGIGNIVITFIKGIQAIRRENFEHKVRKGKLKIKQR